MITKCPILLVASNSMLLNYFGAASLTALFKHIESIDEQMTDENLRERTLIFIRDKVITSLIWHKFHLCISNLRVSDFCMTLYTGFSY